MHTQNDNPMKHTEILQHRIQFWLRDADGQTAPESLDSISAFRVAKLITEGYREGELCVLGDDGDTEFRGWWGIAPADEASQASRAPVQSLSSNAGAAAVEAHSRHLGIEGDLQCQVAHLLVSVRVFCQESGVSFEAAVVDANDILRG